MFFKDLDRALLRRFLLVTVTGFTCDFAVAYVLIRAADASVSLAATAGFVSAFLLNCILHERLTFRSPAQKVSLSQKVSLKRSAGIVAGAIAALATRLLVIAVLTSILKPSEDWAVILVVFAAGVSCAVNFCVSAITVRPEGMRVAKAAKA